MRIVFIATGDIALPAFRHLLAEGPGPLALVTQPDKPAGRKQVLTPPRIKVVAEEARIPVMQPERIGDIAGELRELKPDLLLVMAYGQLFKSDILELPDMAIVNLHASLLPKYRGAACIQAAIDAGEKVTGVTAQYMVKKLDAGDIIHAESLSIAGDETAGVLHDRLAGLAVRVMSRTIELLAKGEAGGEPQDETLASYIGKLEREDGALNWKKNAEELERRIRAYDPWPGTYTTVGEKGGARRLKVFPPTKVGGHDSLKPGEVLAEGGRLWVGTGGGSLELTTVQPEGAKRMAVSDYLLGHQPTRFT